MTERYGSARRLPSGLDDLNTLIFRSAFGPSSPIVSRTCSYRARESIRTIKLQEGSINEASSGVFAIQGMREFSGYNVGLQLSDCIERGESFIVWHQNLT